MPNEIIQKSRLKLWIRRVVTGLLLFMFFPFVRPILEANIQELARARKWDQFLVAYWEPSMNWLSTLTASIYFWGLFGFVAGITATLWFGEWLIPRACVDSHDSKEQPIPGDENIHPPAKAEEIATVKFHKEDVYPGPLVDDWRQAEDYGKAASQPVQNFPLRVKSDSPVRSIQCFLSSIEPAIPGFLPFELPIAVRSDADQRYELIGGFAKLFDFLTWKKKTGLSEVLFHQKGHAPRRFIELAGGLDYIARNRGGSFKFGVLLVANGEKLPERYVSLSFDDANGPSIGNCIERTATMR